MTLYRLSDLAVCWGVYRGVPMAALVLQSWADDSGSEEGSQHKSSALAGFAALPAAWERFEEAWRRDVLGRFELPYVHMREFKRYAGPFAKFKDDAPLTVKFNEAMIKAISNAGLTPFACATRIADLRAFNAERGRQLNDYALNLYGCFYGITRLLGMELVQLFVDRTNNVVSKIAAAERYARSHPRVPQLGASIQTAPIAETLSAKNIPALQAADFLAWELRRDYTFKDPWFDLRLKADNYPAFRASLFRFSHVQNLRWPFHRRSLGGLARATKLKHVIWHYQSLCAADDLRNGLWSAPEKIRRRRVRKRPS